MASPPSGPNPSPTAGRALERALAELVPQIAAAAAEIERAGELPAQLAQAIGEAGLFRALLPDRLGGAALALPAYVDVIERLARADASTAWCVNQCAVIALLTERLPPAAAEQVWKQPGAALANGSPPGGTAVEVEGGHRLRGRFVFASGCHHASWLGGAGTIQTAVGRDVRFFWFPRERVRLEPAWDVRGLRGTGSDAFTADDLFVPRAFSTPLPPRQALAGRPVHALNLNLLFACGFGAVAIGTARAALDAFAELAQEKRPTVARARLRDEPRVQAQVGEAEAVWLSARALLREAVREVWSEVERREEATLAESARLRLAGTHAIRLSRDVVDRVYELAGTTAIFAGNPFARSFQDIHVLTQHLQARHSHYELAGQVLLGLEPERVFL